MCVVLVACNSSNNTEKTILGQWERSDADSSLYGTIVRVEAVEDGSYVGIITYLTDTAKEVGFKTGDVKWQNLTRIPSQDEEGMLYYEFDDLAKNKVFKEESTYEMMFWFDNEDPDNLTIYSKEDSDVQHYRRI